MDSAPFLPSDNLSNSSASTPPSTASPRTDFSASADDFAMIYNQSPPQSTAGFPHLAARPAFDHPHTVAATQDKQPGYPFAFAPPHQQEHTMSIDVHPHPHPHPHQAQHHHHQQDPPPAQQYWSGSSSTDSLHSQGASFLSDLQHAQMKLDRLQHEASPELYYSAPAPPQHISQPMPQPWNYTPEAELPDQIDAAAGVQHGMAYGAPADAGTLLRSSSYTSFGSEHGMQMDYSSDSDGNIYASAAIPLTADPSALHDGRLVTYRSGSETGYDVKEERRSPELGGYSRPGSSSSHHSVQPLVFRPQMMQVMHTDDAASKETQFLRRKCHNCHTTEPPSWRRSTLTPGKIVCNKCGLYERTHGRTRPHRFDELRCGTKVRKTTKIVSVISRETSPNTAARFRAMAAVKGEDAFPRRASTLESEASDASRSVSRNGSAYNSPNPGHAYPSDSPIRVPQAPMKSATLPMPAPYDPSARPLSSSADYYAYQRRSSLPNFGMPADRTDSGLSTPDGRRHSAAVGMPGIPEATGWQTIPVSELTASPSRKRN